jgi:branched-chain amino acid transport system substrate-binding protein
VLTKLKGSRPDAFFYGGMDATAGPLLKQARELGIEAVFSFGDGSCTEKMTELAGAASDGFLCSQAGIPPLAASKSFLDAYTARFKIDPILYAPFTYDGVNLLIAAMKNANSSDPGKYLPGLRSIEYTGATGKIAFDDKGDRKDAEMTIFRMSSGKLQPIAIIRSGQTIRFEHFIAQAAGSASAPASEGAGTAKK